MTDEEDAQLEAELESQIRAAAQNAENIAKKDELANPLNMFDYLYQDMPQNLRIQREELSAHIERQKSQAKGKPGRSAANPQVMPQK